MAATPGVVQVEMMEQSSHHTWVPSANTINGELRQLYMVQFDGRTYSPLVAATAVDPKGNAIPAIGADINGLLLVELIPTQVKDTNLYTVECIYKNFIIPSQVSVEWGNEKYVEEVYYDANNKAIQNSAGDFYNPSLKRAFYYSTLDISFALTSTPDVATITSAVGCVNSDAPTITIQGVVQSFSARQLMLASAPIKLKYSNNAPMWSIEFHFIYNPNTWDVKVEDKGLTRANPTTGKPNQPILDGNGHPVTVPFPLNGSGAPLTPGGTVVFNTFQMQNQAAFIPLFAMVP